MGYNTITDGATKLTSGKRINKSIILLVKSTRISSPPKEEECNWLYRIDYVSLEPFYCPEYETHLTAIVLDGASNFDAPCRVKHSIDAVG
ncbi:hypothetical protein TNCV_1778391 [Trichonephila clavipes]|nr:hypothetical protein TNCV_1778391 [Trichonephila clavipes]